MSHSSYQQLWSSSIELLPGMRSGCKNGDLESAPLRHFGRIYLEEIIGKFNPKASLENNGDCGGNQ